MSKPRDWQDQYYDGDDLGGTDEQVAWIDPLDDTDEDWYSDLIPTVTIVDEATWEWLTALLDEEDDDGSL